jgi:hypothetical protein
MNRFHRIKTPTYARHSKLHLETMTSEGQSFGQLGAFASVAQLLLPRGMEDVASFTCWVPNQVWNDGKAFA